VGLREMLIADCGLPPEVGGQAEGCE
jgi:hypothetical protein